MARKKGNSSPCVDARRRLGRAAVALFALAALPATPVAAQPSHFLSTYVLFAQDSIRLRTAAIADGDVGVNDGLLYSRGTVVAPKSDFVGGLVHLDPATDCEDLFANMLVGGPSSCPKAAQAVPRPVIPSIAQACNFPAPFPACDPSKPVLVDHNQIVDLPLGPSGSPGVYGDLLVQGGGAGPAILKLAPGEYRFCSVRVGRNGSILFRGATTVSVSGKASMSNATDIGPDSALGASAPPPGAIKWYVQGAQVRYSRKGNIGGYVCAPGAKMTIGSSVTLKGQYVARSIRLKRSTLTYTVPIPGVCGDTVLSPGEQCERDADCGTGTCVACACQSGSTTTTTTSTSTTTTVPPPCTDDADCNEGSTSGAFICVDGHCIPGGSSTTTTTTTSTTSSSFSTTSTPTTSTSSSSMAPCMTDDDCPVGRCQDGVCVPECTDNADCNVGSPTGSFVCVDGRCQAGEACGDCIDNDGDGLVDFEDPDCCNQVAGVRFEMQPKKGRFRPRAAQVSSILLKGALARSGLGKMIDPPNQQVTIQIRSQDGGEVLCARLPAASLRKTKKGFRYARKKAPLPAELAHDLDAVRIKVLKSGQVRFRVKGKKAQLTTPAEGTLTLTVGFAKSSAAGSQNACSQAVRLFRGGKKGALRFP